ncbi:hypothetical protein KC573_02735, partial [candidate division WWE3 bacterium]|nr:hypothetical protein [candidate division WWE3 bacterium]
MSDTKAKYDASSIQVLEGLEPVRKRPGMYIGDTGEYGFHHLLREIINNAVDEGLAERASLAAITFHTDGSVTVLDDGDGIPVDVMPKYGKSALEVMMTKLHSGGKFEGDAYKVSGGLHGVGISVANALSEATTFYVKKEGSYYKQDYSRGDVKSDLLTITEKDIPKEHPAYRLTNMPSGTVVTFKPDPQIFGELQFDFDRIKKLLRNYAFLTSNMRFELRDERTQPLPTEYGFHFEGGLSSFVRYINKSHTPIIPKPLFIEGEQDKIHVEVSLQYHNDYHTDILSFTNNIETKEGGFHETGF